MFRILYLPSGEYIRNPYSTKPIQPCSFAYKFEANNLMTSLVGYYKHFDLSSSVIAKYVQWNKLNLVIIEEHFEIVEVDNARNF